MAHWTKLLAQSPLPLTELISLATCLECARLEGGGKLASALSPQLDELLPKLVGDWDDLVPYLNAVILPELPEVANRLFIDLRRVRGWRLYRETKPETEAPASAHVHAALTLTHTQLSLAPADELKRVFDPICVKLRASTIAERKSGVQDLIRVALTHSHWYLRDRSQEALSYLGLEAAGPLMSVMKGELHLDLTTAELEGRRSRRRSGASRWRIEMRLWSLPPPSSSSKACSPIVPRGVASCTTSQVVWSFWTRRKLYR